MNKYIVSFLLLMVAVSGVFAGDDYTNIVSRLVISEYSKILALGGDTGDMAGHSVAISGDTMIVGMPGSATNSGCVYVYVLSGSDWVWQGTLVADDRATGDRFGSSVAIYGDVVVVGAPYNDDGAIDSGSAYVFRRSGGRWWDQEQKLTGFNPDGADYFGCSVSICENVIAVGSCGDNARGPSSGSAYAFKYDGSGWVKMEFAAPDGASADLFGSSVSVSRFGDYTIVVGAPGDDDDGNFSGSAYVFVYSNGAWSEQAKLTAADGAAWDEFGFAVAIGGNNVIVGAYRDDDKGDDSGSAYVFTRSGTTWTQQQKLTADDGEAGNKFGYSVAISGINVIIGANKDNDKGGDSGSAYVFSLIDDNWNQMIKLTADDGYFGCILCRSRGIRSSRR